MARLKESTETQTTSEESVEAIRSHIAMGSWIEEGRDLVRKRIAVRDETMMRLSRDSIIARIVREKHIASGWPGLSQANRDMDEAGKSMTDSDNDRVMDLYRKRIAMRNRLCDITGGRRVRDSGEVETWMAWGIRITERRIMKRTAHTLANLKILRLPPGRSTQRRGMSDDDLQERERDAESNADWMSR